MLRLIIFLFPLILGAKEFNLLVIHSYSSQYEWTEGQAKGFLDELNRASGYKFNIKTEYLDTKRIEACDEYIRKYNDFLAFKYSDFTPDAIYVTDDNALRFIQKIKTERYRDVPVFFSGINDTKQPLDPSMYTGIFEQKEITTNFSLIHALFPKASRLLIIGDNSTTYRIIKKQIESIPENQRPLAIDYAESASAAEIARQIAEHPGHIPLLTTIGKLKNEHGVEMQLSQIIVLLASQATQPIFCMEDVYMHPELFGGFTTDARMQGKLAAQMLLDYAEGETLQNLPAKIEGISAYLFSAPQLEHFDISLPETIKKEATLLYQKPSFFQANERLVYWLIGFLLFVIFAGLLLFALFILKKNRLISTYNTALERNERRLREMFSQHAAVMLIIDPETSAILDANKAAESFYGYSIERLKTMKIGELNTLPRDQIKRHEQDANERIQNYFTFQHRLANGEIRDVEVYSSPIHTEEGHVLFSIIHDITEVVVYRNNLEEQVRSEIDRRRQNEQLMVQQSKHAAMGEMINAIAHQWRQPLNALGIFIQDLEDAFEYNELNSVYLENMVRNSMSQINFMSRTIDDFRDFFRPDKSKTLFHAKTVIEEVIALLRAQLKAHSIELFIEGEDFTLENYTNEFKQVILNIVNNAKDAIIEAKMSRPNSEREHFWIKITLSHSANEATVIIDDNAGGISDSVLPRIFEPYFTTKEQGKGTGIGLYLVKTIVEEHMQGIIHVANSDEGARFTISLKPKEIS